MSRIAHISDIHFGAHDPAIVTGVEEWVLAKRPDVVIISGDFTQRAREKQFREAGAFVNRLRGADLPVMVIPGNHDIPLYDVARRFLAPLERYKRYISDDLCPWYETDELAILGLNTARSLTTSHGRISHEQMDLIRRRFVGVPEHKTRILVTHHPLFAMPIGETGELTRTVGRHEGAIEAVCRAGVHICLAGHFHRTFAEAASKMAERAGKALVIQAGTATSTRIRADEPQSFNWLHARANNTLDLQVVAWNGREFTGRDEIRYLHDGDMWQRRPVPAEAKGEAVGGCS